MKKYILLIVVVFLGVIIINLIKTPIDVEDLKEKYTDEYSHFISINNLEVHYKKKGKGLPVLLIHGTSSSLHTWEAWEAELSKKYTTYSIDMQGGGLTSPPADDIYSIQSYIDLIDAFVETLDIDSFYLVGNSLGGHTAWSYAANSKNASKVKKLVLVDPSGFFDPMREKPLVFQLAQFDILFNNIENINTKPFVKKSLEDVFYNDDLITKDLINRYADLNSRAGNRKGFFLKVRQIEEGDQADLKKITCPTLIQWGEDDLWIPISLASIFTENIPNNQLISYKECGHVPMEEIPEKSVKDVLVFFDAR